MPFTKYKCDKCKNSYLSAWAVLDFDMKEVKKGTMWTCAMGHKAKKKDSCKDFIKG